MPQVAEGLQWHNFRTSDPGVVWMRGCLRKAADELSTTPGDHGAASGVLKGARTR
jgi:hypothetical protein